MSYNTIFMGTPEFAVPFLQQIQSHPEFELKAVVTQEDKKTGRKQILTPSPIKQEALKFEVPVFQPKKVSEIKNKLTELNPDIIIVVAYGQIIPKSILNLPKFGSINIHASLLPKYRGSSCLCAPILHGDDYTGITVMKMRPSLDTGEILEQTKIKLNHTENLEELHDKLAETGKNMFLDAILRYIRGEIVPQPQDETQACYVGNISKQDGKIDLSDSVYHLERKIRAYNPWPGVFGQIDQKKVKLIQAGEIIENKDKEIGELFTQDNKLYLQLKNNLALEIKQIQPEGKKILGASEFIRGYPNLLNYTIQ